MIMTATHAVLAGIPHTESGLAAGLQNTARQLGGAVGVAALAHAISESRGAESVQAVGQLAGYHAAFIATAVVSAVSAFASLLLRHDPD